MMKMENVNRVLRWRPFRMTKSSAAEVFGIPVYGAVSDLWWHQRFIRPIHRFASWCDDIHSFFYWRFTTRGRQYSRPDIGLRPGYHDPSTLILHSSMAALGLYIEEMGGVDQMAEFNKELREDIDQAVITETCHQADNQETAADIWIWWTVTRVDAEKRIEYLMERLFGRAAPKPSFVPLEGPEPDLVQYVPPKWSEEEEAMHAELRDTEKQLHDDTQKMLIRLMEIRESLWS